MSEVPLDESPMQSLRRGLRLSPELREGLGVTLLIALIATGGRVIIPVVVQTVIDRGLRGPAGPDIPTVLRLVGAGAVLLGVTIAADFWMSARLVRAAEHALSGLRVRAFRHVHDLSVLHQAAEQRGALVSRVTSDVDAISQFVQWGGVALIVMTGQIAFATLVMLIYSVQLTLVVLAALVPMLLLLRWFQRTLAVRYGDVRERVGHMLTVIAESVVAAPVIRAFAIEQRTNARIEAAVEAQFRAAFRAGRLAAVMFTSGELFAGTATAGVVVGGALLVGAGDLSLGQAVAFLFLVSLFVAPVQIVTEVLDLAQTAIAGWRRILALLETPADVADPADGPDGGTAMPPGPVAVRFVDVSYAYPGRSWALRDVDLHIPAQSRVAVVGATGSGKTTFAKLLTRLMDPTEGHVLVNGARLDRVRFSELRRRIVMVPQDGFLFDDTIEENVRHGHPGMSAADIELAFVELGLADWLAALPAGLATRVGERGEYLSVGERQLIALTRAYVANPDLLLLDEATSAVDPVTEVRIPRALESLTRGRTAIWIAHRLSTAEAADEVLVFDAGRLVQRGPHARLVRQPGVYAALHRSWVANVVS